MTLQEYPKWQKILRNLVILFEKQINWIYDLVIQVNPYQSEWLTRDYNFNKKRE